MNISDILTFLNGSWIGEEDVAPTPWMNGGPSRAFVGNVLILGGNVLAHDYATERDGRTWFSAHGVMTRGASLGDFRLFWFDSFGFLADGPASGHWDGTNLAFERISDRGTACHTYSPQDDNSYRFHLESSAGSGSMSTVLEGIYRRA